MQRFYNLRMLFSDRECPLVERFSFTLLSLTPRNICQTIECGSYMRMLQPQGLFPDRQRSLIVKSCFCVFVLLLEEVCQPVKRFCYTWMTRIQGLLPNM